MIHECVNVTISGRVQGVGYRYFTQDKAAALGLTGWVRNLPNGDVEALAQGARESLIIWIKELARGPALAQVTTVRTDWRPADNHFKTFDIR